VRSSSDFAGNIRLAKQLSYTPLYFKYLCLHFKRFDEKSGGLCSEEDYPYKAKQGKACITNCTDVPGSIVKSFIDVPKSSEKALLSAIAMQPISVAIQADQFIFQFYKNGVITDQSCGKTGAIDHGVLAGTTFSGFFPMMFSFP